MRMNTRRLIGAAFALVLAGLAAAVGASAQDRPAVVATIAVVDVRLLLQQAAAAKDARAQVEQLRAGYQKDVDGKLERLATAFDGLKRERAALSDGAYQQRLQELRQTAAGDQREVQSRQDNLDGALNAALEKIGGEIERIVDQMIRERRLTVVLPRSAVLGTAASADLTPEVLKRLDQRMSSVVIDKVN